MSSWRLWLRRIARRIWFRAAFISVLSVILALASAALAPFIPYEFSLKIGSDSVDSILTILASSMLAVTTFSLTAMVAAFSRAAQHVTPRASQLLIEDKTAQNALSTFIGAFLFAIVGIIALSTDFYGAQGRVLLFIGTALLIAWIAFILLRWIDTLTRFGRVEDAVNRVEEAAKKALAQHRGPIRWSGQDDRSAAERGSALCAAATGYVTFIDRKNLNECAVGADARVTICAPPGTLVTSGRPVAWVDPKVDDDCREDMQGTFDISDEREFAQDPRFAMVVLAEIGSRALSPGINDPGTAISVLNAGQRVIEALTTACTEKDDCAAISDQPLSLEAMVEDLVLPLARDSAGLAEVAIRLQQMLGAIAGKVSEAEPFLRRLAGDALDRVRRADPAPADLQRVERAHRAAFS